MHQQAVIRRARVTMSSPTSFSCLARHAGEPDDHVPSPVDKNVVYVRLVDRNVLANSETRTALDDALKFAFPMAQHLRNVDQVEGCLWCVTCTDLRRAVPCTLCSWR